MLRITLAAVAVVFAVSVANAEALKLTDTQMDAVRAGAGLLVKNPNAPVPNGGIPPWSALFAVGFGAVEVGAGPSGITLLLPR